MKYLSIILLLVVLLFFFGCDDDSSSNPSTKPTSSESILITTLSAINDSFPDSGLGGSTMSNNISYTSPDGTLSITGIETTDTQTTWYTNNITYNRYTNTNETPNIILTGTVICKGSTTTSLLSLDYNINLNEVSYQGTNYIISGDLDYSATSSRLTYKGNYSLDGVIKTINLTLDF